MPDLSFVLYRSETGLHHKGEAARALVELARRRNEEHDLTGFLHHDDGFFFQWLEGHPDPLASTMARIELDPRHRNLVHLARGVGQGRRFCDRMGYSTRADASVLRWLADHAVTVRERTRYATALLSFLQERANAPDDQLSRSIWRSKASV